MNVVIINDGMYRYPMLREELGVTKEELMAMSGDEYSIWCSQRQIASDNEIGSRALREECEELEAQGCAVLHIGGGR